MVGGTVIQVVPRETHDLVEVLDESNFDRQWRIVDSSVVKERDSLWWQSFTGYLTRRPGFNDRDIGTCKPSNGPAEPGKHIYWKHQGANS